MLRKSQRVVDYHHSYGLLSEQLKHLLHLAGHPDNDTSEFHEIAEDIFASLIAIAQHSAEQLEVFVETPVSNMEKKEDHVEMLVDVILSMLERQLTGSFEIKNPVQFNKKMNVVAVRKDIIRQIMELLYLKNLLPDSYPDSLKDMVPKYSDI